MGLVVMVLAATLALLIGVRRPTSGRSPQALPATTRAAPSGTERAAAGGSWVPVSPLTLDVPPGYDRTPAWGVPIARWTRSFATDDGIVVTRDPAGHVLQLDPATGRTLWRSAVATQADEAGPWPATIDGVRVAFVAGPGQLTYWPLPVQSPDRDGGQYTVALPPGTTVSLSGPSPLVQLPDHQVAVIRSGALVTVPLPVGARALSADDDVVLAVTSSGWIRQRAATPAGALQPLPRPANAGPAPLRLEAVGTVMILVIWPGTGSGQVVALMDTRVGRNVITRQLSPGVDLRWFTDAREIGGTQLAVGSVVVDTYAGTLDVLDPRYLVEGLARGHAWATFEGRAMDLHLTATGALTAVPFGSGLAALPVGVSRLARSAPRVFVVAPAAGGTALYGLRAG